MTYLFDVPARGDKTPRLRVFILVLSNGILDFYMKRRKLDDMSIISLTLFVDAAHSAEAVQGWAYFAPFSWFTSFRSRLCPLYALVLRRGVYQVRVGGGPAPGAVIWKGLNRGCC
jgi:hypothetical protein